MSKDLLFQKEARERLLNGVNKLANAVAITLGPKGRNGIIYKDNDFPLITNDGISIAKEISFPDKYEQMGAQIVLQAASKTNEKVGDGTTSATVLTRAISVLGINACEDAEKDGKVINGANPVLLRKGIEKATKIAIEELDNITMKINNENDIKNIATISSASEEIGNYIYDAIKEIGENGVITTKPSHNIDTSVVFEKGYEFDRGLISPAFIKNKEKMNLKLENPKILVTDQKINTFSEILPLCEELIYKKQSVLLIVEDIAPLVLQSLIANVINGNLSIAVVKAPGLGKFRKEILEDIAIKFGSEFISLDNNFLISNVRLINLGTASQVIVDMNKTIIINDDSDKNQEELESRIASIKNKLESNTISDYDRDKYKERIAKLSGGVATILIGAATEIELQEKTLRIEDAINATKAAISGGILPGGGTALFYITERVNNRIKDIENEDEKKGAEILLSSLSSPIIQIANNAGKEPMEIIKSINEIYKDNSIKDHYQYGYDAYNDEYVNLIDKGIIDPADVTKNALLNASSTASVFITTDVAIVSLGDNI